jgi:hypothetical protein
VKVGFVAVIFGIPTLDGLVREYWPPRPMSREELYSLGAYEAMRDYCNWQIEETWKADDLMTRINRFPQDPSEQGARAAAKESFKDADCNKLLFQFPDMYRQVRN